jgi:GWxTD domain-containing protein
VPLSSNSEWYFRASNFYNTGKDSVLSFVNDVFVSSSTGDTSAVLLSYLSLYPEGQPIGGYGKRKTLSLDKKITLRQDFDISKLNSGNYYIVQKIYGTGNKELIKQSKMIQLLNKREGLEQVSSLSTDNVTIAASYLSHYSLKEIKRFLAATEVISTESAYQINRGVLQSKDSMAIKARLLEYWKLADENNPETAFNRFAKRLNFTDQRYAVKGMPVWKTDRARVLLIYGEPNVIENEFNDRSRRSSMGGSSSIPYEIWTYNKIDRTGAQGFFVFVQDGGIPNFYKLLHSSVPGEISNSNWRNLLNAGRSR